MKGIRAEKSRACVTEAMFCIPQSCVLSLGSQKDYISQTPLHISWVLWLISDQLNMDESKECCFWASHKSFCMILYPLSSPCMIILKIAIWRWWRNCVPVWLYGAELYPTPLPITSDCDRSGRLTLAMISHWDVRVIRVAAIPWLRQCVMETSIKPVWIVQSHVETCEIR